MLDTMHYRFDADARRAFEDYLARRVRQPNFANARSVRNALDRARLRQANRLFAHALGGGASADPAALTLLSAADIRASSVFSESGGAGTEPGTAPEFPTS
jgi:AAA lid domain